ncbi:MAG: hypothetical protein ACRCS6_11150, partial [Turicibacter sp.]
MDFIVEMGCAFVVIYCCFKLYTYKNIPRMLLIDYLKLPHKKLTLFVAVMIWVLISEQYRNVMPSYVYWSINSFILITLGFG